MLTVVIRTDRDLTPSGKRRARVVGRLIRWYVGGRRYNALPVSDAAVALSREWAANEGAPDHLPQPWSLFR